MDLSFLYQHFAVMGDALFRDRSATTRHCHVRLGFVKSHFPRLLGTNPSLAVSLYLMMQHTHVPWRGTELKKDLRRASAFRCPSMCTRPLNPANCAKILAIFEVSQVAFKGNILTKEGPIFVHPQPCKEKQLSENRVDSTEFLLRPSPHVKQGLEIQQVIFFLELHQPVRSANLSALKVLNLPCFIHLWNLQQHICSLHLGLTR